MQRDNGINPPTAIDQFNNVVEVHQVGQFDLYLHYSRGTISGSPISFTKHPRFDYDGAEPAVIMTTSGKAVEVQRTSAKTYYRGGTLSTTYSETVDWIEPALISSPQSDQNQYPSIRYDTGLAVATWTSYGTLRYSYAVLP